MSKGGDSVEQFIFALSASVFPMSMILSKRFVRMTELSFVFLEAVS
jgi:hypothetical protein